MGYCQGRGGGDLGLGGSSSRVDLTSLTPLSVAGCGRLQLEVPLAHSVDYCK